MNLVRSLTVGFVTFTVLAGAALTAIPAQAASGAGPYYAPPAWDRTLPAATRFVILKNMNSAAVLDKETGLVWERFPDTTTHNWPTARDTCINKSVSNRKGWRLPSIPELASLIDPSVAPPGPSLLPGHPFPTVQSAGYWSATTSVVSSLAWSVDFSNGFVDTSNSPALLVWCVRGGMNAPVY